MSACDERAAARAPAPVRRAIDAPMGLEGRHAPAMTGLETADRVYGTMYGVHRTTIYLPEDLKERLAHEARRRGVTEAQVIREALAGALTRPRPRGGLVDSGDPAWAGRDEELLAEQGFGE